MKEINEIAEALLTQAKALNHKKFVQGAHELLDFTSRLCKYGFLPSCLEDVQEGNTPKQVEEQKEDYFYLKLGGWRGGFTRISLVDLDLAQYSWHIADSGYVEGTRPQDSTSDDKRKRSKCKRVMLHQIILERKLGRKLCDECETHHLSLDKTDNARENLIELLKVYNSRIKGRHRDNTSGYLGVSRNNSKQNPWKSEFYRDGERKLAYFQTAEEGAAWYMEMAQAYLENSKASQSKSSLG